jgi:hypothetical protein
MATVTRGFYRRFYGLAADIAQLTPGDLAEDTTKTAILRITDEYYCTDSGLVYWWNGTIWIKI